MICIKCNTDNKLKERTESGGKCKSCRHPFVFDPKGTPDVDFTDKFFASTLSNLSVNNPCFGGPKNQPMLLTNLYRSAIEWGGQVIGTTPDNISAYLASFQKCSLDLESLLKPEIWRAARSESSIFEPDLNGSESYINRLMFLNIKYKGADHILTKVNNLTRSVGLLGLSPLFDQRIVELSLQIPPQFKLSGAQEKAVLKSAVWNLLPEQILTRPKSGMMVPVQLWFRKYWQRKARALLLNRRARISRYLNQDLIKEWLNYRGDLWSRYGVKLWLLVSLELWLQAHMKE